MSHITLVIPRPVVPSPHREQLAETTHQSFKVAIESHNILTRTGSTPLKTTAPPLGLEQPSGPASRLGRTSNPQGINSQRAAQAKMGAGLATILGTYQLGGQPE